MSELMDRSVAGTRLTRLEAAVDRLDHALQSALSRAEELETGFTRLSNASVVDVDRRLSAIRDQIEFLSARAPEMTAELREILQDLDRHAGQPAP